MALGGSGNRLLHKKKPQTKTNKQQRETLYRCEGHWFLFLHPTPNLVLNIGHLCLPLPISSALAPACLLPYRQPQSCSSVGVPEFPRSFCSQVLQSEWQEHAEESARTGSRWSREVVGYTHTRAALAPCLQTKQRWIQSAGSFSPQLCVDSLSLLGCWQPLAPYICFHCMSWCAVNLVLVWERFGNLGELKPLAVPLGLAASVRGAAHTAGLLWVPS